MLYFFTSMMIYNLYVLWGENKKKREVLVCPEKQEIIAK